MSELPSLEGRVLVTDAGRGSALAFIRSLDRAGMRVIAADSKPWSPGMRSRHAARTFVYPDPRSDPSGYCAAIASATKEWKVDLVVPVTDETLMPLAGERERFGGVALAIPPSACLEVARDKSRTLARAEALGIRIPRTERVATVAEALKAAPTDGPIVLKPRHSRVLGERGIDLLEVTYARDRDDLRRAMAVFEGRCDVLLQEYAAGVGVGVEVLAHEGRVLAAFAHRRLRELPPHGGRSAMRVSIELEPTLFDASERLIRDLGYTGLAMVEWKVGGGAPVLMEVNGRVWGSLPLALASGMDFPARLASLYLEGPPAPEVPCNIDYERGVRGRNLVFELKWIASVALGLGRIDFLPGPGRLDLLRAIGGLLDPRVHNDVQSLADPLPGLIELRDLLLRHRRKRSAPPEGEFSGR